MTAPTRRTGGSPKLDAICADAVDLAAAELAAVTDEGEVGEHLGVRAAGERLVDHLFACTLPGYRGWSWVVSVARAPRAKRATVCETVLLPGDEAVLAPDWTPWSERLQPSDVGPDDALPRLEDDPRLDQGFEQTDDLEADVQDMVDTLGLGRARVLNRHGRDLAAERWENGDFGSRTLPRRQRRELAHCASCGFLTKLDGALRQQFGVCANEWSPADGRVVSLGYGCGAHSETTLDAPRGHDVPEHVLDELRLEVFTTEAPRGGAPENRALGDKAPGDEVPEDEVPEDEAPGDEAPERATPGKQPADGTGTPEHTDS